MNHFHRFPLPYASLSSCYRGLTGKSCDWLLAGKNRKRWIFKNETRFEMGKWTWEMNQVGVVMQYHSAYSKEEMHRLYIQTDALIQNRDYPFSQPPVLYTERMEIEEVMYRGNTLNEKIYHVYLHGEKIEKQKKTILLVKSYKWKTGDDIHHLVL